MPLRTVNEITNKYDLIAILGYGFVEGWKLSPHSLDTLEIAAKLYKESISQKIAVCGRWSRVWDQEGITPPVVEAQEMKSVLIAHSIPETDILEENNSKETITNAYFLKTTIIKPKGYKKILLICTDYHVPRVEYIFYKMFEDEYTIDIFPIQTQASQQLREAQYVFLKRQKKFLDNMKKGEDSFLKERIYSDPYFHEKVPDVIGFVAKGKLQ